MLLDLVRPCADCPFRTDVRGYLRYGRAVEIARSIAEGSVFPCHKTTAPVDDDEAEMVATSTSQFCAGALIVMEHEGVLNQAARSAERLGLYDPSRLDMESPVHRSFYAFTNHHRDSDEDEDNDVYCIVSDAGCEAPAGYLIDGVAVPSANDGVEVLSCSQCGEPVCESCAIGDCCPYCADFN